MRPAKGTEGEDKSVSESVKIGGIGKNPAVDKINSLQAIDIKGCAVRRMQEAVHGRESPRQRSIQESDTGLFGESGVGGKAGWKRTGKGPDGRKCVVWQADYS